MKSCSDYYIHKNHLYINIIKLFIAKKQLQYKRKLIFKRYILINKYILYFEYIYLFIILLILYQNKIFKIL